MELRGHSLSENTNAWKMEPIRNRKAWSEPEQVAEFKEAHKLEKQGHSIHQLYKNDQNKYSFHELHKRYRERKPKGSKGLQPFTNTCNGKKVVGYEANVGRPKKLSKQQKKQVGAHVLHAIKSEKKYVLPTKNDEAVARKLARELLKKAIKSVTGKEAPSHFSYYAQHKELEGTAA